MILGWVRLAVFGFVALSVVYLLVSVYSRSTRREALEKEFDAGGIEGDRDDYIRTGMQRYQHGLRRKLILLVYVIPTVVVGILVWANFQWG